MSDIFDLEQQILEAWRVVDDIEIVYHGMDSMTEDQQMNVLLGVEQLYRLKFEKLWATFESHVRESHAIRKERDELKSGNNAKAIKETKFVPPITDAVAYGLNVPDPDNIDWAKLDIEAQNREKYSDIRF